VALAKAGEVRILGVTAPERVPAFPDAPTCRSRGDTTFVNWRGFFAAPGLPEEQLQPTSGALEAMLETAGVGGGAVAQWAGSTSSTPATSSATFLEAQEEQIGDADAKLGFL
jgi:putative tricarboxylic transport membrane protein